MKVLWTILGLVGLVLLVVLAMRFRVWRQRGTWRKAASILGLDCELDRQLHAVRGTVGNVRIDAVSVLSVGTQRINTGGTPRSSAVVSAVTLTLRPFDDATLDEAKLREELKDLESAGQLDISAARVNWSPRGARSWSADRLAAAIRTLGAAGNAARVPKG